MKNIIAILLALILASGINLCSCASIESANSAPEYHPISQPGNNSDTADNTEYSDIKKILFPSIYGRNNESSTPDVSVITYIHFEGNSITVVGDGTVVDGNRIAITSSGRYSISGTLDDGQIVVRSEDQDTIELILDGLDITCSTSSPIYVHKARETVITLAEDSSNYITDGTSYIFADSADDEPNAAVFSKDDLTINGSGSLTVNANYNNGIQSKDDLIITGGDITVNAVNDGIKGRDSVVVAGGTVTVNAGGDGIQSTNDSDSEKGFVSIESGILHVTSGEDGIQTETSITISNGDITIASGGGSMNSTSNSGGRGDVWGSQDSDASSSVSAKGIKAAGNITINGGSLTVDSSDDAINSNDGLMINSGTIALASGDDGMHADSAIEINGGVITISKCYEGLESASITINGGTTHLVSSDDGVNVVSVNGEFFTGGPIGGQSNRPPGPGELSFSDENYLSINGGYFVVDANGDGLDVNGAITMTSGFVVINGPTRNDNGALDHSGFKMTGGFLVAAGSSGMAQAPDTSSTQYSVMMNLSSSQSANTMFHIENEDGEDILTFVPTKTYQSVVLCSPDLKNSSTYVVYSGGSSTGTVTDGLYSGGIYTAGTQITDFTISSITTRVGSSQSGGFPGGGRR